MSKASVAAAKAEEKRQAKEDKAEASEAFLEKHRRALVSVLGETKGARVFERERKLGFKKLWPHPDVGK